MTIAQRLTAHEIITRKGQAVTLIRQAGSGYDPATGSNTIIETMQAARAVFLPLSPYRKANGALIAEGDQQMLLSALKADGSVLSVPHVDDDATDAAGNRYAIIAVDPLTPAGLDILYDCVVRRAA